MLSRYEVELYDMVFDVYVWEEEYPGGSVDWNIDSIEAKNVIINNVYRPITTLSHPSNPVRIHMNPDLLDSFNVFFNELLDCDSEFKKAIEQQIINKRGE